MNKWWEDKPYFSWSPLVLPHRHSQLDIEITSVVPECTRCNRKLTNLRARFYEFASCLEIRCAGVCHHCELIVYSRFRWYPDNRMLFESKNGWVESQH